jgi:hypothetical protein
MISAMMILIWDSGFSQMKLAPLTSRMAQSQLVVEAEVILSESYFGKGGYIYSSHVLAIKKVMKGSPPANRLEVVLRGGTVDGRSAWISHHLYLAPGNMGIFFLNPHPYVESRLLENDQPAYDVFADLQGCIRYKEQPGTTVGSEPFRVYRDIERDLYPLLGWQGGGAPKLHQEIRPTRDAVAAIDSIRPLAVTAGTRTELSIHGSGFLDTHGKVFFKDADDGGQTLMAADQTDIQEWSDTLIRLWVPSVTPLPNLLEGTAGSGSVLVQNSVGDSALSAETLIVEFAVQNGRDQLSGISRYAHLIDHDTYAGLDTLGGYTFRLSSSFSGTDSAEKAFRKALRIWRCATGVNFKIGADTILNVASEDSVNLIKWDDNPSGGLPFNVLARTEARIDECQDLFERSHFSIEIDLTFSKQQNWNFDTSLVDTTKWDFLSIALHELGHAHLLYHVIDTMDLMHHSLDSGTSRRTLTGFTLDAGNWVIDSSTIAHGSCPSPMNQLNPGDCNLLAIASEVIETPAITIFPNPGSGRFTLLSRMVPRSITFFSVFDASGNLVKEDAYNLMQIQGNQWNLDMESLPNGIYFLRIERKHQFSSQKIILLR